MSRNEEVPVYNRIAEQRELLGIVRAEALYFAPQRMTRIMNEGWASYWHSRLMTEKALRDEKNAFAASAAQDPFSMAGKAVEVGFGILQGRPAPEGRVLVPVSLITRDNIAGYRGWTNK
mgnify:CR=1 FL=1